MRAIRDTLPLLLAACAAVALSALGLNALGAANAAPSAGAVGSGYWHTSGSQILDSGGNPVRIAGINWYGFETPDEIAHGLWAQDYHAIINDIKNLGYNHQDPVLQPDGGDADRAAEPELLQHRPDQHRPQGPELAAQILDKIIGYAGRRDSRSSWMTTAQKPENPPSRTACGTPARTRRRPG